MTEASRLTRLTGEALALCYRGATGYEAILRPTEALVLSGAPHADFNYAVIDASPRAETVLREFAAIASARKLPLIVMAVSAVAERLRPVAAALGLQDGGTFPLMERDASMPALPSGEFECRQVTTDADRIASNQLLSRASGIPMDAVNAAYGPLVLSAPGLDVFIACRGGEPICSVQTTRAGADVGIWAMVTPPEFQRQGAGRALLAHALAHHVERGAQRFYLGSTAAGRRLYESAGFVLVDEWAVWLDGDSSQAHG